MSDEQKRRLLIAQRAPWSRVRQRSTVLRAHGMCDLFDPFVDGNGNLLARDAEGRELRDYEREADTLRRLLAALGSDGRTVPAALAARPFARLVLAHIAASAPGAKAA